MHRFASRVIITGVAGYFAFAAAAHAATLTGSIDLTDTADSLQIGQATVSGISCLGAAGCGGEMLAVTSSPGGYAGIEIVGASGGALLTNTSSGVEDVTVGFEVQSSPGNISAIGLVVGNGSGTATVGESVVDYGIRGDLANTSGNGLNSSTMLTLPSADNNIYITKDIAVYPDSSLISVTQYFYDVPGPVNSVPEPGMIGLFGLGLGALFFARRARIV